MALGKSMESVKNFFAKIGKRNLIIAGAVVLVVAAVCLNFIFFAGNDDEGYGGYEQGAGMTDGQSGNLLPEETGDASASYFSAAQVSRSRARDDALEVLQQVVDSSDATAEVKAQALTDINKLALEMEQEAIIEQLVLAKGFTQCVAILNGDSANIVVKCESLTPSRLAQINEIVYEEAGIDPSKIKIIEK